MTGIGVSGANLVSPVMNLGYANNVFANNPFDSLTKNDVKSQPVTTYKVVKIFIYL